MDKKSSRFSIYSDFRRQLLNGWFSWHLSSVRIELMIASSNYRFSSTVDSRYLDFGYLE